MLLPNTRYKYSGSSQSSETTARNSASYSKQGSEERRWLGGTQSPGLPKMWQRTSLNRGCLQSFLW